MCSRRNRAHARRPRALTGCREGPRKQRESQGPSTSRSGFAKHAVHCPRSRMEYAPRTQLPERVRKPYTSHFADLPPMPPTSAPPHLQGPQPPGGPRQEAIHEPQPGHHPRPSRQEDPRRCATRKVASLVANLRSRHRNGAAPRRQRWLEGRDRVAQRRAVRQTGRHGQAAPHQGPRGPRSRASLRHAPVAGQGDGQKRYSTEIVAQNMRFVGGGGRVAVRAVLLPGARSFERRSADASRARAGRGRGQTSASSAAAAGTNRRHPVLTPRGSSVAGRGTPARPAERWRDARGNTGAPEASWQWQHPGRQRRGPRSISMQQRGAEMPHTPVRGRTGLDRGTEPEQSAGTRRAPRRGTCTSANEQMASAALITGSDA